MREVVVLFLIKRSILEVVSSIWTITRFEGVQCLF